MHRLCKTNDLMFFSYIVRKFYSKDRTRDSKVTKTSTEELPEAHVSEDEFSDSDVDFSSNDVGGRRRFISRR